MILKRYLHIIVISLSPFVIKAQQQPDFSQFVNNKIYFSPANISHEDPSFVSLYYQGRWVGISDSPFILGFNFQHFFKEKNMGLALSLLNDKIGFENNINIRGSYCYQLTLKEDKLNLGIGVGALYKSLVNKEWITPDLLGEDDIVIPNSFSGGISPNFHLGILYSSKEYHLGISAINLLEMPSSMANITVPMKRIIYLHGGYDISFSDNLELKPQLILSSDMSDYTANLTTMAVLYNKFHLGVNYLFQDSMGLIFGIKAIDKLLISYSYNYPFFNELKGSHEVFLRYSLELTDLFDSNNRIKLNKNNRVRGIRFL
ncbi:PorP/SprF family type IX secretion system membrane protein [Ichthyobacterium seriolicida]|uniref:Type IX secretion system membrane protein, PorP/SprF family n=1 Tax=Ichthyobacterium seriolicida TaxID=242600 RepID=A0A1J1E389_9FLAO|nr:PorP/SprF family type IX secretion system membrane protein [Ichthyobacterium seriolicida]BAV95445.1 hypothetical protein JBKA6_1432 [Ichthyobacterium seriolicida]